MIKKVLFIAGAILFIETQLTWANECGSPDSVTQELMNATAVFTGKAVAEEYRPVSGSPADGQVLTIKLAVEKVWKGDIGESVAMYTTITKFPDGRMSFNAEDFRFAIGIEYLVYAFGPPDRLQTSECKRTKRIERAKEDLRELGEGRVPEKKTGKTTGK